MVISLSELIMQEKDCVLVNNPLEESFVVNPEISSKDEQEFLQEVIGLEREKEKIPNNSDNEASFEVFDCLDVNIEEGFSEDDKGDSKKRSRRTKEIPKEGPAASAGKRLSSCSVSIYNEKLTCKKCKIHFLTKPDYVRHKKNHKDNLFSCPMCSKVFDQKFGLKIHLATHGTVRTHKCDICDKAFTQKRSLKDHLFSHTGEKPFQCSVCNNFYRSELSLKNHSRSHFDDKKYECSECKKTFFHPSELRGHMGSHKTEKEFICEVCSKGFSYYTSLKRHSRIHTEEPSFFCDECDKVFRYKANLRLHKRVHLGLKPYKCLVCDRNFATSFQLKRHGNTHKTRFANLAQHQLVTQQASSAPPSVTSHG